MILLYFYVWCLISVTTRWQKSSAPMWKRRPSMINDLFIYFIYSICFICFICLYVLYHDKFWLQYQWSIIWFNFGFKKPFGIRDLCSWHQDLKQRSKISNPWYLSNIYVLGTTSRVAKRTSTKLAIVRVVVGRGSAVRKSVKVWRRRSVRPVMTLRWRRSALTRRWWTASAPWATRSRTRSTARPPWAAPCSASPAGGSPGVGRLG